MCHNCLINEKKIIRLPESLLKVSNNDKMSSFADLFGKNGSVAAYARNVQVIATEMFQLCKIKARTCFYQIHYNLRNANLDWLIV